MRSSLVIRVAVATFLFLSIGKLSPAQTVDAKKFTPKVPIPVEFMAGNDRMFFQMVVKRSFAPESRFGFLSVSSFSASYDNEMEDLDVAVPVLVNYKLYKGFGVVGGLSLNNAVGFSPLVGVQHSFSNREWVSVTIASYFLNARRNVELFGLYEYKPAITPKVNLYTRVQFLYIHSTRDNLHARSFLQVRAGVKMKAFSTGLGTNLDQYGPERVFKPNYGVFVGWAFE